MHSFTRLLVVCGAFSALSALAQAQAGAPPAPAMVLTVQGFSDRDDIPVRFRQASPGAAPGEGTSPAMNWSNVPAGTQSFVLNMRDLDVARNRGTEDQAHWVVWNIPATATGLPEGVARGSQLADGSFQISATGPVYRGPGAPATGPRHHYMFEIYALDTKLAYVDGAISLGGLIPDLTLIGACSDVDLGAVSLKDASVDIRLG